MRIIWTAPALREIEEIGDYIALENPPELLRACSIVSIHSQIILRSDVPAAFQARENWLLQTRHSSFPIACAVTELKCCLCSMGLAAGPIVFDS